MPQNPHGAYSGELATEYEYNLSEFNRKAREWTLKYASQTIGDLKMIYEIRFLELENRNKSLEENLINIKN